MKTETGSLLKNKPFMYLMSAQVISNLGDWLSLMAIFSLMAFKWEVTPLEMSFVILALGLPMAILGPVAGVLADKANRKVLMIVSDLFRCAIIFTLVFAASPWHVYSLLILLGTFSSLFNPAKSGLLKELVDDQDMQQAASISSVIQDATKIIGPALSGFLVAVFGNNMVYIFDSASFLLSAFFLFLLPSALHIQNQKIQEKTSFIADLKEGFRYIKTVPFILYGTLLMFISMLILQMADAQFPVLIRTLLEGSPTLVGLIVTCSGAGFLVTGLCLARWQIKLPWLAMTVGIFSLGTGFALLGYLSSIQFPNAYIWGPVIAFLASSGGGFIFIPFNTTVQKFTPVHLTGRVFGLTGSLIMVATLIGPVTGGIAANHFGAVSIFVVSGAGLVTISIAALFCRKLLERSDQHVTESASRTQGTTTA